MILPKTEIYNALSALGYSCIQGSQAVFQDIPAITFLIDNNSVNLDLQNDIASQDVVARVDIWADKSTECSTILSEVEEAMRAIGYRLASSVDVPSPEGALCHINCRFTAIKI